jgi:hypothetical protein
MSEVAVEGTGKSIHRLHRITRISEFVAGLPPAVRDGRAYHLSMKVVSFYKSLPIKDAESFLDLTADPLGQIQ